jgi:hypothetical protein
MPPLASTRRSPASVKLHDVDVDRDALFLGRLRFLEMEVAFLPLEHRVDDLAHLELHAFPEILGRERPHLHERLAWRLPLVIALIDASYSSTVIFPSRSSSSPRRSFGRLLEANTTRPLDEERLLGAAVSDGQHAGRLRQPQVLQDLRERELREIPLQSTGDRERLHSLQERSRHISNALSILGTPRRGVKNERQSGAR